MRSEDLKNIAQGLIKTFKKAGDESIKIEKEGVKVKTKEMSIDYLNPEINLVIDDIIEVSERKKLHFFIYIS